MNFSDLDLNIGNNDFFGNLNSSSNKNKRQNQQDEPNLTFYTDTTQKLSSISKQVLGDLEKDAVLPLPENFEAYFKKTLSQEEDENIREKIREMMDSTNHDSHLFELEKVFNDNLILLKNALEHLLTLCKQMSAMQDNTNKRILEIEKITNPLGAQNAIKVLMSEIRGFHKQFVVQADFISRSYRDMYTQSSIARSGAMFDTLLGIHTRSFLLQTLELECKNGKHFPRHCAVVVFAPSRELVSKLNEQNQLRTTFKSIAGVVLKTIGAKDVISYLGSGRFGMLLKNVQVQSAIALCEEVIKNVRDTHIFIDGMELHLRIVMGGVVFDVDKTPDTMLEEAKEQLQKALNADKSLEFVMQSDDSSKKDNNELSQLGDNIGSFGNFDLS